MAESDEEWEEAKKVNARLIELGETPEVTLEPYPVITDVKEMLEYDRKDLERRTYGNEKALPSPPGTCCTAPPMTVNYWKNNGRYLLILSSVWYNEYGSASVSEVQRFHTDSTFPTFSFLKRRIY